MRESGGTKADNSCGTRSWFPQVGSRGVNGFCEPLYILHVATVYDRFEHPRKTYTVLDMSRPTNLMYWIQPLPEYMETIHRLWSKCIQIIVFIRFIRLYLWNNEIKIYFTVAPVSYSLSMSWKTYTCCLSMSLVLFCCRYLIGFSWS